MTEIKQRNKKQQKLEKKILPLEKGKSVVRCRAEIEKANAILEAKREALEKDKELKTKYLKNSNADWSAEQKNKQLSNIGILKNLPNRFERPEAYYARAARLSRESEEDKKISSIS